MTRERALEVALRDFIAKSSNVPLIEAARAALALPSDPAPVAAGEHTPGPWRQGVNYPSRIIAGEGNARTIVGGTCLPADEDSPNAVELANARLIASAPTMLAALKDVQAAHDGADTDWMRAVETAIGRATGGEG
mgnify:CR=1 FL=1